LPVVRNPTSAVRRQSRTPDRATAAAAGRLGQRLSSPAVATAVLAIAMALASREQPLAARGLSTLSPQPAPPSSPKSKSPPASWVRGILW